MSKFLSIAFNIFWVTAPTNKWTSQKLKLCCKFCVGVLIGRGASQHKSYSHRARLFMFHVFSSSHLECFAMSFS